MFGRRKITLNTTTTLRRETPEDPTRETAQTVDIEDIILTAEGAIVRTACGIGLVIVGVVAVKSLFRTLDTVVQHVYK